MKKIKEKIIGFLTFKMGLYSKTIVLKTGIMKQEFLNYSAAHL